MTVPSTAALVGPALARVLGDGAVVGGAGWAGGAAGAAAVLGSGAVVGGLSAAWVTVGRGAAGVEVTPRGRASVVSSSAPGSVAATSLELLLTRRIDGTIDTCRFAAVRVLRRRSLVPYYEESRDCKGYHERDSAASLIHEDDGRV